MVTEESVRMTMNEIRALRRITNELEKARSLKIVDGVHDMDTGQVNLIE